MNAGSLAADAGAAQQPHAGERELHDDNAERQKGGPQPVVALLEHHQYLGNTAALGLGAGTAHHEHGRQHPQRGDQHRPQRRVPLHLGERLGAQFRHPGEPHGDQTDHQRADPEHHPHLPVLEGAQLPTGQTPGAKQIVSQQAAGARWLGHGILFCVRSASAAGTGSGGTESGSGPRPRRRGTIQARRCSIQRLAGDTPTRCTPTTLRTGRRLQCYG